MIEFIEEEHLYLVDGVIVPSVSEILRFIFPNKYKDVPRDVLKAKANYGTKVHNAIEMYENNCKAMAREEALDVTILASALDYVQVASLNEYLRLKEKNKLVVIEQEQIIHLENKYAGRFDMIAKINNDYSLCDVKTTSVLDKEYLSWQLSLYAFARPDRFDKLYAIWLPKKDLGQLVEIERKSNEEILDVLTKYEESKIWKN